MYAPNGGFGAAGSSLGSGVPVNPAGRMRTAGAGAKSQTALPALPPWPAQRRDVVE